MKRIGRCYGNADADALQLRRFRCLHSGYFSVFDGTNHRASGL